MSSPFVDVLADLKGAFERFGLDWYVFGAQAALLYGSTRLTADVDVTVRLGGVDTSKLVAALDEAGFDLRVRDPGFVATTRVLPIVHRATGIVADVVLSGPGLEDLFLERAEKRDFGGTEVPVARAEDIVVMKLLAGRPKDHEDVAAILRAQHGSLDTQMTRETLALLEEALSVSDMIPAFEALLAAASARTK